MNNIEIAGIEEAVISVVLSRAGMRRYRNADPLELNPSDLREIVRLTVAQVEARRSTNASPQGDELPQKIVVGVHASSKEYAEGWNDCIDEYGAACRASAGAAENDGWISADTPPDHHDPVLVQLRPRRKNEKKPKFAVACYFWPEPGTHDDDEPGWFDPRTDHDVEVIRWKKIDAARNTQPGGVPDA
jgi:hypothetical protein